MSKSASRGSLLLNSSIVSDDGAKLTVSLPTGSHFAARMLERADVRELYLPIGNGAPPDDARAATGSSPTACSRPAAGAFALPHAMGSR